MTHWIVLSLILCHCSLQHVQAVDIGDHSLPECIRMKFGARLNLTYSAGTGGDELTVEEDVPTNVSVSGDCNQNNSPQNISLTFFDDWVMTFNFVNDDSFVAVTSAELVYNASYFDSSAATDTVITETRTNITLFQAPSRLSYTCASNSLSFDNVRVDLSDIQVQAFMIGVTEFGAAHPCVTEDGNTGGSDLVPIIAGAVIASIVIIVFVIFFLQRRRQHNGM